jgi:hypothetical protein
MAKTATLPWNCTTTLSLGGLLAGVALGGCIYATAAPVDPIARSLERVPEIRAVSASDERVDATSASPDERGEGRWRLRGDGSERAPFYWAWVPAALSGGR